LILLHKIKNDIYHLISFVLRNTVGTVLTGRSSLLAVNQEKRTCEAYFPKTCEFPSATVDTLFTPSFVPKIAASGPRDPGL
jgi:hypothetical protein